MLDLDELVDGLLQALQRAVPSDWVSINDVGPDPEGTIAVVIPEEPEELHEIYRELALQNPLAAHYAKTSNGRPYRISDVVTTEEFHALEIYQRLYGPMGVEHQIAFILPGRRGGSSASPCRAVTTTTATASATCCCERGPS